MDAEKKFMIKAIEEARSGSSVGDGGPFGVVIAKDGEALASAHNTVLADNDPTRHAEIKAISAASRKLGNYDLSGCDIYSTTEPCPMCFGAIHWARIDRLFYGTGIEDVKKLGFNELAIPAARMKKIGSSPLEIRGGFMREECEELLRFWENLPDRRVY
ncbi:MAG: nucleoside deaminase [Candidatus Omnitrophota bacterium]|jgi:tRNA(Arg) A34 adenosine deaminase TadA